MEMTTKGMVNKQALIDLLYRKDHILTSDQNRRLLAEIRAHLFAPRQAHTFSK